MAAAAMTAILLKGETLREKRRYFNELVNETILKDSLQNIPKINVKEPDIDNLFKIDIANSNKDVDYILGVLKCEDMLYVSRAIKHSDWLINDEQYSYIVNPAYLHDELLPRMISKARNKFLLKIRLNLRNEDRAEDFFKYFEEFNFDVGLKWLPSCSRAFIEEKIAKYSDTITPSLIKRLCKKSVSFLDIYCKHHRECNMAETLQATTFLLHNNLDRYLDIVENSYYTPNFNAKATKILLKKCPDRILDNLAKYAQVIDIPTFSHFIQRHKMLDFILEHIDNTNMQFLFKIENLQHLIKRVPSDVRFQFVKQVFIYKRRYENEQIETESEDDQTYCNVSIACQIPLDSAMTYANIYHWYKFATFDTAFADLKNLIRNESNPNERNEILSVMLHCTDHKQPHIQTLLQYYREHHINEPFKYKIQFINKVLSQTRHFDKEAWGYLNDIFKSMEVYEESNNNVRSCIKSIILYNLINDKYVPDIIENKFVFETLGSHRTALCIADREKVFSYLYTLQFTKLDVLIINIERHFNEIVDLLENILNLMIDWIKDLSKYPIIIKIIKQLINHKHNSQNTNISKLYNMKKSWRRLWFKESILLCPSKETYLDVMKHQPNLLEVYQENVYHTCLNNALQLERLFKKVRTWWPSSLCAKYKTNYFKQINEKKFHKNIIFGLCILLPYTEMLELINKHVPNDNKINWNELNDTELNLQKNIARNLHVARPQPSLSTILLFARGDYLQFVLPSLNSILYSMSMAKARKQIKKVINAPVSLQKHGIRIAFNKLKSENLATIFKDLWVSTKNNSIRADIFKQTFSILCKEPNPSVSIEDYWILLNFFIDNLSTDENKTIYRTLSRSHEVPLCIRPEFWVKSYKFLKALPDTANCTRFIEYLEYGLDEVIEHFEADFVVEMFVKSFSKELTPFMRNHTYYLALYLLTSKNEETQTVRYQKVLMPLLIEIFTDTKDKKDTSYNCNRISKVLTFMYKNFDQYVLGKGMVTPIAILDNILTRLTSCLKKEDNYVLLTSTKLALAYITIIDDIIEENKINTNDFLQDEYKSVRLQAVAEFGNICLEFLKLDVKEFFSSIYIMFAKALNIIFDTFYSRHFTTMKTLERFLECEDFEEGYLLVLQAVPRYTFENEARSLRLEMLNKIGAHSSKEIKMHYKLYQENTM